MREVMKLVPRHSKKATLNVTVYGPQPGIPALVMGIEANGDIDEYHPVNLGG